MLTLLKKTSTINFFWISLEITRHKTHKNECRYLGAENSAPLIFFSIFKTATDALDCDSKHENNFT
jgi:hypothetical protein